MSSTDPDTQFGHPAVLGEGRFTEKSGYISSQRSEGLCTPPFTEAEVETANFGSEVNLSKLSHGNEPQQPVMAAQKGSA